MKDPAEKYSRVSSIDHHKVENASRIYEPAMWVTLAYACLVQWPLALLVADGSISKFDAVAVVFLVLSLVVWMGGQRLGGRFGGPGWSALLLTAGAFLAMRDAPFAVYLSIVMIAWALASICLFQLRRQLTAKICMTLTVLVAGFLVVEYFGLPKFGKSGKSGPRVVDAREGSFTVRGLDAYKWLRPSGQTKHKLVVGDGDEIFNVEYNIDQGGSRQVPGRPAEGPRWMLFGGSHTFGNGLADDETIAARLQQMNPEVRIYNFGVPWCGTADAYFHLKSKVNSEDPPSKSFYFFIDDHIVRAAAPDWSVTLYGHYERPCFELRPELVYVGSAAKRAERYPPLQSLNYNLLLRSKLYRALNTGSYRPTEYDALRVAALAVAMRNMARDRNGGSFLFVFVPQNNKGGSYPELTALLKRKLQESKVPILDCQEMMQRRWQQPGEKPDDYFIPYDKHPSKKYAQFVAQCVDQALRQTANQTQDSGGDNP